MDTTYGMACPVCVWMVDNRPTTEHVEREYLAHVRAQHPENVERVVAEALAGECRANRAAAGLTPYWAAYWSTARRPCTFHRYRRLIERSSMERSPFLGLRLSRRATPRSAHLSVYHAGMRAL